MFLNRTREILGLDIGSHTIKLVALRPARGDVPYELVHFGVAELPDEAVIDGAVVDRDAVSRVLNELLDQHRVRGKQVATSVSGNAVIVRRVSMPRSTREELQESIHWDAEEYIPFDIDEVNLDFEILDDSSEEGTMDVLLVAAKRDRIQEYVSLIESAKREPIIVDVDAFAMQNAFEYAYPERQYEDVALLNLGASIINVAVLEAGQPAFWRDIAGGSRQYIAALQREFMLDPYDAEEVLHRASRDSRGFDGKAAGETLADWSGADEAGAELTDAAADPRVAEIIGQVSERIIGEIKRTIDFYQSQAMREHFDAVFLAGGGAHVSDLAERLETRLGWPVERLDPMRRVLVPERGFDQEYVNEIAPQATVAVGLALRGMKE